MSRRRKKKRRQIKKNAARHIALAFYYCKLRWRFNNKTELNFTHHNKRVRQSSRWPRPPRCHADDLASHDALHDCTKKKERAEIDISFFFFFPLFKKSILQPPTSSFPFWKRILLFFFFVDFSKKKFCSIQLSLITHLRRRSTAFVLGWGPRCGPRELCHRWRSSPGIVANRNDRLIDSPKPAFFNRFKINMIMMK